MNEQRESRPDRAVFLCPEQNAQRMHKGCAGGAV